MNRTLQWLNLVGVLGLAALCVVQWQRDRRLNLDLRDSEKTRMAHEQKLSEQEKNLRGLTDDLTQMKEHLGRISGEAKDSQKKLQETERDNLQLTNEREQLRQNVTNWANAVKLRDERLGEANEQIRSLGENLKASVEKYNQLATNYNSVVDDLNKLRGSSTNSVNSASRQGG